MKWDTIAKTGTYQDMNGKWHTFTEQDFDAIAQSVEPGTVPLVIGHPNIDSPAYGWVGAARRMGNELQVSYQDILPEMRQALDAKAYKFKSMSLLPGPNGKKLRHVGLLGATPPAIPGLGPVQFGSKEHEEFALEEQEQPAERENGMTIEEEKALKARIDELTARLKESEAGREKAVADKKAVEASFSAYKQEVVVATRKKRLESLVNSGRVTPAEAAQCLNYAQAMAAAADITMDFAADDGKSEKISVEEHYWRSLEARETSPLMAPLQAPKEQQQEVKTINTAKL